MGWFDSPQYREGSGRFRQSYDYASGYVRQSPTIFTAVMTLVWCVVAVLAKQESIGAVAGPGITALLFLAHNIHARKAHREVSDALDEVRAARIQVDHTRNDLRANTEQTMTAAESAAHAVAHAQEAAASVARVEALTKALTAKIDALHAKGKP